MPAFSPDGHALAYRSNESGRTEVYVRQLSNSQHSQISTDGVAQPSPRLVPASRTQRGEEPIWSHDGRRLFYRNGDLWMVSEVGRASRPSAATVVVKGPYLNVPGLSYDVARDGRLLLLRGIEGQVDASPIHVVSNFADAVRRSQR